LRSAIRLEEYNEIFKRVASAKKMDYDERALGYLIQEYYIKRAAACGPCIPRPDRADGGHRSYLNVPKVVTKELIDQACAAYFVDL
jgi:hypothetical protein